MRKNFRNIDTVKKNLKIVSETLKIDYYNIFRPDYNHTNNVEILKSVDKNEMPSLSGKNFKDTDGIVTDVRDVILMSTNADCNLILMYDPIKNVIANIHAGWKGTFEKIVQNAVNKMKKEYECDPKNIICCFCPSIRKCHFEVDEDIAQKCENIFNYLENISDIIIKGDIKSGKQKYYIDMILINKTLLLNEGVLDENIIDSEICSVCSNEKVHSRRVEGEDFELSCALIQLKKILPE